MNTRPHQTLPASSPSCEQHTRGTHLAAMALSLRGVSLMSHAALWREREIRVFWWPLFAFLASPVARSKESKMFFGHAFICIFAEIFVDAPPTSAEMMLDDATSGERRAPMCDRFFSRLRSVLVDVSAGMVVGSLAAGKKT